MIMDEPKNDLIRKNRITALLIGFGTTLLLVGGCISVVEDASGACCFTYNFYDYCP
jgi:hypothetical protein